MAVQSEIFSTEYGVRSFISTKHIATKQHMSVWLQRRSDNIWFQLSTSNYELINNSAVLTQAPNSTIYSQVEIRVADTPDELGSSQSEIAVLAGLYDEIVALNGIKNDITTVAGISGDVTTVSSNISDINSVVTNIVPNLAEILQADTNATIATTKATEASASATSASNSATIATNQATIATTKAGESSASEASANNSATTATTKASEANASAISASNSATSASSSANTATTKANEASASASSASTSATQALGYRNEAEAFILSKAFVVDTIEALSTIPSSYTTAIVKDLDRGGTFIWSATGTANGGTVFAGATGYWNRQYSGAVNVKWFGAKGDGVMDCSDILNFIISTFSTIYLPSGSYGISKSLDCIHNIAHNIFGDGGARPLTSIVALSNFNGNSMLRQWADSWYTAEEKLANPTTYGESPPSNIEPYVSLLDRYINISGIGFIIKSGQVNKINCIDLVSLQETSQINNILFNNYSTSAGYPIKARTVSGTDVSFNGVKVSNMVAYGRGWDGMAYFKGVGSDIYIDNFVTAPSTCNSYPFYFLAIDVTLNNIHCEASSLTTSVLYSSGSDITICNSFFIINNSNNGVIFESKDESGYSRSGITISNTVIYAVGGLHTNISNYNTLLLIKDRQNDDKDVLYYQNSIGVGAISKVAIYNKTECVVALGGNANWHNIFTKTVAITIPATTAGNNITITHDIFKNNNVLAFINAGSVYGATGNDYFNNPQMARLVCGSSYSGSEYRRKARLFWDVTPALFSVVSWDIATGTIIFQSSVSNYAGKLTATSF